MPKVYCANDEAECSHQFHVNNADIGNDFICPLCGLAQFLEYGVFYSEISYNPDEFWWMVEKQYNKLNKAEKLDKEMFEAGLDCDRYAMYFGNIYAEDDD